MISNRIRLVLFIGILLIALIPAAAQTNQELKEESRTITVHSSLPPYQLRLVPSNAPPTNDRARVGQIIITRQGDDKPLQTLDSISESGADIFLSFFRVEDINFDGYLDIAAPIGHGAKWMSFNYWVFDAKSGKFISNALTKQLRGLSWNEMTLSPKDRTIHVTHLNLGGEGTWVGEVYKLENNQLRVVAVEKLVPAGKDKPNEFIPKRFKPTAAELRSFPPKERF
ncbi:MAG TPA: hypothetical protein PLK30_27350 [Blastocatellia bacterium]|nr:hypothetical protein [Blastocatellia bacterium]